MKSGERRDDSFFFEIGNSKEISQGKKGSVMQEMAESWAWYEFSDEPYPVRVVGLDKKMKGLLRAVAQIEAYDLKDELNIAFQQMGLPEGLYEQLGPVFGASAPPVLVNAACCSVLADLLTLGLWQLMLLLEDLNPGGPLS